MGMSTGGGGDGFLADINVTPFVDVMLVLLIIFMVTAPMMTQGLEVDLPQTKTVTTLPKDSENLVLTIKKDGSLHLAEYEVPMDGLQDHVKRLVTDQKKMLFLRADREVPYGVVVQVMGLLKGAGVDKLGVVAEPEPAKDDKSQGRAKK
ncbi:protein TolR [Fundidesulfovibrio terrae]|uniref:protein TolR n=1 Tax=Fundidesulfovibrio terrae TaxID=2922866 RepID=UPI001FAF35D6|nr:protein TolR [Fundidesulfovibrio terrae]